MYRYFAVVTSRYFGETGGCILQVGMCSMYSRTSVEPVKYFEWQIQLLPTIISANTPSVSRSRDSMSARISSRDRIGWGL